MAFANINGVIAGATAMSGVLTLPSGSITSFIPSSGLSPGGVEMVYGLLETLYVAVADEVAVSGTTRLGASANSRLMGDDTLRKTYTFTVDLDIAAGLWNTLDVKAEPA